MARTGYCGENMEFAGNVVFTKAGGVSLPAGVISDADVPAGANINDTKLNHRHIMYLGQDVGTAATSQARCQHIYKAGSVLSVMASAVSAAAGGDYKTTMDVLKSTGGGAFVSILSAPYDLDSSKTSLVTYYPAISGVQTVAAGDLIKLNIAVSGSTGSQAQGTALTLVCSENGT